MGERRGGGELPCCEWAGVWLVELVASEACVPIDVFGDGWINKNMELAS